MKAKHLAAGQTIGVIAPASPTSSRDKTEYGLDVVRSLGFKVKAAPHLYERNGYLAGADADRAADLNAMFADDSVDAIWCIRGGYGAMRILPMLDYDVIHKHPKALIGYSDITALHCAIHAKADLITFHGPIASQTLTPYTLAALKQVLYTPSNGVALAAPPQFVVSEGVAERENRLTKIVGGKARGKLIGGNLCTFVHLLSTPYMPDLENAILFFEDVDESMYRIDRFLSQLWLNGALEKCAAVVFGKFSNCVANPEWIHNRPLDDVLSEYCIKLNKPSLSGMMIGHIDDQATIPFGAMAELDADAGTLTLLEPAVT